MAQQIRYLTPRVTVSSFPTPAWWKKNYLLKPVFLSPPKTWHIGDYTQYTHRHKVTNTSIYYYQKEFYWHFVCVMP